MATFTGTPNHDTYSGTNDPDTILGVGGNDTLSGRSGADIIRGGLGNDYISGYMTGSYLAYDDGAVDRLYGDAGNDLIGLGAGDYGDGGIGNDTLVAGGAGTFIGGTGIDTLRVQGNADISGSVIGGIERLEADDNTYGVGLTANLFTRFTVIAGIGTNTAVTFQLTGAGAGTAALAASVKAATIRGSAETEQVTFSPTSAAITYIGGAGNGTVFASNGADTLAGGNGSDHLRGGGGDDYLTGYMAGSYHVHDDGSVDRLFGDAGNDLLALGIGDIGDGGIGNDTLVAGGAGSFFGGTGIDTLRVTGNDDITGSAISSVERLEADDNTYGVGLTANVFNNFTTIAGIDGAPSVVFQLTGAGSGRLNLAASVTAVTIRGSNATEGISFAPTSAAITYVGGAGSGTFVASNGADTLSGDDGADVLRGGAGNDQLSGYRVGSYRAHDDRAIDRVYGEAGNDLIGVSNGDLGDGGDGNDTLDAGDSATLIGGTGDDLLIASPGDDLLNGGAGSDTASYERASGDLTIRLAVIGAQVTGGGGTDTLAGIENLVGGRGDDTLVGTVADNVIEGGAGNDSLVGAAGIDTASYARATAALIVDLRITTGQNTFGAGIDTLSGFENLTGGSGNDSLTGTLAANVIEGGAGNDSLYGLAGVDTASYAGATAGVTVNLALKAVQATVGAGSDLLSGFENLRGSAFADRLTGDGAANLISGLGGADTLVGGAGLDTLAGGAGNDTYLTDGGDVLVEAPSAAGGIDRVLSSVSWTLATGFEGLTLTGAAATSGTGNAAANGMIGNVAANRLAGLAGNDVLSGGAGNDTLTGGQGADTLFGGAGNDIFDFNLASESTPAAPDVILGFDRAGPAAGDRIDLSGIDAGTAPGDQAFVFGTTLTLVNRGNETLVRGNTDADAEIEFTLVIRDGAVPASSYVAADFIL